MKTFTTLIVLKRPPKWVWSNVRDRLPALGALLEDIESIVVLEREQEEIGRVRLVNEWISRQRIPGFVQKRLGTEKISWLDHNVWDDEQLCCTWRIEPAILSDQIRCSGTTLFEPAMAGKGTRVTFSGTFELDATSAMGIGGTLDAPVRALVESVVTVLIPKNFRKLLEAAARMDEAS